MIRQQLTAVAVLAAGLSIPNAAAAADACADMDQGIGRPLHLGDIGARPVLCRDGYVLAYNPDTRNPDWVLELVTPENIVGEADRDNSSFKSDSDLAPEDRVIDRDYRGSGFDRGHQAPAADMKWDQEAMDQSFLFTNMAPQQGIKFNRGVWAHLEGDVRNWVEHFGPLVVITGPVYGDSTMRIGHDDRDESEKILVPEAYFKIVYDPKRKRAMGFLLPHKKLPSKSHGQHLVPIREIEDVTGLDFFPELSRRKQNLLELNAMNLWR